MSGEPSVWTADVRAALDQRIRPDSPDAGDSVVVVSERSQVSTRTIYRILKGEYDRLMELDMADRLLMAADGELWECHMEWPDGKVEYP